VETNNHGSYSGSADTPQLIQNYAPGVEHKTVEDMSCNFV